mgnify:CR=1 FL=1
MRSNTNWFNSLPLRQPHSVWARPAFLQVFFIAFNICIITQTIKKVNKKGFTGTKKLKTIIVKGTKSFTVKKGAFKNVNSKKITVKVNKKMSAKEFKKLKKNLKKAGFKGKIKK